MSIYNGLKKMSIWLCANEDLMLQCLWSKWSHFARLSTEWHEVQGCGKETRVSDSCLTAFGDTLGLQGALPASVNYSLFGTLGKILAGILSKLFNPTASSPKTEMIIVPVSERRCEN